MSWKSGVTQSGQAGLRRPARRATSSPVARRQRSRNSSASITAASPSTRPMTSWRLSKSLWSRRVFSRRGSSSRWAGVSQRSGPMSPPPQKAICVVDDDHLLVMAGAQRQLAVEHEIHPRAGEGLAVGEGEEVLGRGDRHGRIPAQDADVELRLGCGQALEEVADAVGLVARAVGPGIEEGVRLERPVQQMDRALRGSSPPWPPRNSTPCRPAARPGPHAPPARRFRRPVAACRIALRTDSAQPRTAVRPD